MKFLDMLFDRMRKQFKRPLYKFFMFLFGLPTFIVGIVAFVIYKRKKHDSRNIYIKQSIEELESTGVFAKITEECTSMLDKKYEFFGKNKNTKEYRDALKKEIEIEKQHAIDMHTDGLLAKTSIKKPLSFIEYLTMQLHNPVLLVLSVITSLPLYILMIICLHYFTRYAFERIVMMIFVIFGVVWLVFSILHFSSFDPASNILGDNATEEQIADFNATYGLDQPYVVQLGTWFKRIATFDIGNSYTSKSSVITELSRKFPTTLKLVLMAVVIGIVIALPLGIISALKANSGVDYIAMFVAMILMSMPSFWIGMILLLNLAIKAGLVPATYDTTRFITYILPAVTLSFSLLAFTTRNTRSAMLEVSRQDYVMTARAKGLSNGTVVTRHMLSNALIPIITAASLQIGRMMGGSAVEEKVYAVQGIGNYVTSAVYTPDIPVVIACVTYTAIIVSFLNLFVDLLYAILDPRVKANLKKN